MRKSKTCSCGYRVVFHSYTATYKLFSRFRSAVCEIRRHARVDLFRFKVLNFKVIVKSSSAQIFESVKLNERFCGAGKGKTDICFPFSVYLCGEIFLCRCCVLEMSSIARILNSLNCYWVSSSCRLPPWENGSYCFCRVDKPITFLQFPAAWVEF